MLNENAKLWIEALRSGEYEQGRDKLQSEKGYCCLGVAASVYEKSTGNTLVKCPEGRLPGEWLDESYLPVKQWLGLRHSDGGFTPPQNPIKSVDTLAELNDSGVSFLQLADLIESEPEELFLDEEEQEG